MLTTYFLLLFVAVVLLVVVVVAVIDGGFDYSEISRGRNDNNNNTHSYSQLNPSPSVLDREQNRIQQVRKQHNGKQHYDNSNNNIQKQKQLQGRQHNNSTTTTSMMLNMTLCGDECDTQDCKSYSTPLNICYSSSVLFPHDPSWSGKDIFDSIMLSQNTLIRKIYDTENGTCRRMNDDDNDNNIKFLIPLDECVGPFGIPRPWGIFRLIPSLSSSSTSSLE